MKEKEKISPLENEKISKLTSDKENSSGQLLFTNQGLKVNDNQNSLKAGERGATLLEDFILREKITHFDHERIPERIVHARGSGAHGVFELYESQAEFTKAGFLNDTGVPADPDKEKYESKIIKPVKNILKASAALSMANTIKDTVKTRMIAILATDGVNSNQLNALKKDLVAEGAVPKIIAIHNGHLQTLLLPSPAIVFGKERKNQMYPLN